MAYRPDAGTIKAHRSSPTNHFRILLSGPNRESIYYLPDTWLVFCPLTKDKSIDYLFPTFNKKPGVTPVF